MADSGVNTEVYEIVAVIRNNIITTVDNTNPA